ncbi:MAG: O-antigen ligase family protein [Coriobacteriales bacterium]|nr:O-antigen ligase family protein [Coriobacteriales bacterium]
MAKSNKGRKAEVAVAKSLPEIIGWYALLACVALVPVVIAVVARPGGGTIAFTEDPYHVPKLLLASVLLTVATAAWLVDLFMNAREVRAGYAFAALAGFAVLVGLSTAFGIEPANSLFGASGLMTGAITWLIFAWMAVLVGQLLTTSARLEEMSWAILSGSTIVGLIALVQSTGFDPIGTPITPATQFIIDQGAATIGNPNYTGLLLTVPAVLAVGLAFASQVDWKRWTAGACAVVLFGAIVITITRAAWLGGMVGLAVFFFLAMSDAKQARRLALVLGGAAAGVALLGLLLAGPANVFRRIGLLSAGLDAFSSGRLTMWADTLRTIASRPFLGTGADRLALGAYDVQTKVVTEGVNRYVIQDPHSLPLLIAGSFGVIALAAFLAYAVVVLVDAFKVAVANRGQSPKRLLYASWVAATVGFLAASLLSVYTITGVFALFLALGVIAAPNLKPLRGGALASAPVALVASLIVATALFGGVQSFRAARHVMLSLSGDSEYHLNEAMRIAPWDTRTRVTYLWRKAGSFRAVITGPDAASARQTLASLDEEIKAQIARSPHELLLYRMRVDLYRLPKGFPGYDPRKVLEAIEDALVVYPNDQEFLQWREDARREVQGSDTN